MPPPGPPPASKAPRPPAPKAPPGGAAKAKAPPPGSAAKAPAAAAGILGGAKLKKVAPPPPKEKPSDPFDCPKDGCSVGPWLNQGRFSDETLAGPKWLEHILAAHPEVKCVLVDFFAYSCTNCVRTVASIQRLHATYSPELLVVGVHRPEFDFEKDPDNLGHFLRSKGVEYPVALDNDGAAWGAWDVSAWPTHFLAQRDPKAAETGRAVKKAYFNGTQALFVGDSPANHGHLERLICRLAGRPEPPGLPGPEDPDLPRPLDMEVFLGRLHRYKNVDAGQSCGDGTCVVQRSADVERATLGERSAPAAEGFTVYGAAWCRFCRASKLLLQEAGVDFRYVDVEALGGAAAVVAALGASRSTIPLVYHDGRPLGGYTELGVLLGPASDEGSPEPREGEPRGGGAAWALAGSPGAEEHAARVARCAEEASPSELKFERRGDTATVKMSPSWVIEDERAIACADKLTMEVQLTFGRGGDAPITVYVVGGPDVKGERGLGGTGLTATLPGAPPRVVKTPVANRHYAGTVRNGGRIDLEFELGFCVYALYLTSEPVDAAEA